jgi:predicted enzyme related to lactoylglutathione lyase
VERAIALGGAHLDVGQRPKEGHVVLADPEGNEFCVIEPHNSYLAGCGRLGEVACDGTRKVGLFWSAALGWPLVWDQDEETAVQSPLGGTKVAWGGEPVATQAGPNRQRFEVTCVGDVRAEADRLVALGASRLDSARREHGALLADPDGNELVLQPGARPSP